MAYSLKPTDSRLTWQGVVELHTADEWTMPWRIPYERRALFPGGIEGPASAPAGVRISFITDAGSVGGNVVPQGGSAPIDLCIDGEYVETVPLAGQESFLFEGLPAHQKRVELWLPQGGQFRLKSIELSDGARVEAFDDRRPRWITYGSSITQCGAASSPCFTWPGVAARACDFNLTCLGYGGQCHLDPMIARLIRDMEADYISICCGINIQGANSLSPRAFRPAVIGTAQTIREKHPDIPLAFISPIYSPPREENRNNVGFSLQGMRSEVEAAVDALKSCGDDNVHYFSGLDIFGPELNEFLPDQLHPNAEGYKRMGANFVTTVAQTVFAA